MVNLSQRLLPDRQLADLYRSTAFGLAWILDGLALGAAFM
jgi:hypothetical protein